MIVKRVLSSELKVAYRPCRMDEVIGHDHQKRLISNGLTKGTLPHALLFTGPAGCGKTTFARIIALSLNCEKGVSDSPCCECSTCTTIIRGSNLGVVEVDAARTSDVGFMRSIAEDLPASSLGGERYKVLIVDEAHNLSAKAEDALLKPGEDNPDHVYIIFCTNRPLELSEATRSRFSAVFQFARLTDDEVYSLLSQVSQFEGMDYKDEILKYIAHESNGTPRNALVYLQQINNEGSWTKDAASLILNAGVDVDDTEIFEFCKLLGKAKSWSLILGAFENLKNKPPETIRIRMVGFFVGWLKKSRDTSDMDRVSRVIDILSNPLFNAPTAKGLLFNMVFKIYKVLTNRG